MTNVSLPIGSSNSGTNDWADVYNNDNAIVTVVNGQLTNGNLSGTAGITDANLASPNNAIYKTIFHSTFYAAGNDLSLKIDTTRRVPDQGGLLADGTAATKAPHLLYLDLSNYDVAGKTTTLQLSAQVHTNATAPGINVNVGVFPITSPAGAADELSYTIGSSVLTVSFATPSSSSASQSSATLTSLTAGYYAIGVSGNGSQATDSLVAINAQLQVKNA